MYKTKRLQDEKFVHRPECSRILSVTATPLKHREWDRLRPLRMSCSLGKLPHAEAISAMNREIRGCQLLEEWGVWVGGTGESRGTGLLYTNMAAC